MKTFKRKIRNFLRIVLFFILILAFGGYFSIFNDSVSLDIYRQIYLANLITTLSIVVFDVVFYKGEYLVLFILPLLSVVIFNPFYPWIVGPFNLFLLVIMFIVFLGFDLMVLRMDTTGEE